jgi:ADP-heptose:LPS heptosyltransferase
MRLLVIRTSAMGDVALTLPVLKEMSDQFPEVRITLVTREAFRPFFDSYSNTDLFIPDFKRRHAGLAGLIRLFRDIRKNGHIDYVIDLHDVIRSVILRSLFSMMGLPVRRINKGRKQKRALVRGIDKHQLMHSTARYREVFKKAGYNLKPDGGPWLIPSTEELSGAGNFIKFPEDQNIGIAPFTIHYLKMWPAEYMVALLKMIAEKSNSRFWFFGGKDEADKLSELQKSVPRSEVVAGKVTLGEEIALMAKLNLMISMDSSNMHMAALVGTKVLSIWGATDPLAGFGALNQPDELAFRIPVDELTCRPCTVFGKGDCKRRDHACMMWLTPERVMQKIIDLKIIELKAL